MNTIQIVSCPCVFGFILYIVVLVTFTVYSCNQQSRFDRIMMFNTVMHTAVYLFELLVDLKTVTTCGLVADPWWDDAVVRSYYSCKLTKLTAVVS